MAKQPVQVLLQRIGAPITAARIHPVSSGAVVESIGPEGVVIFVPDAARFAVDVDGGLDETDTGPGYAGAPIHTASVYYNPPLLAPDPADPAVRVVGAGDAVPAAAEVPPNTTLVFGPGEHRIPLASNASWPIWQLPQHVVVHLHTAAVLYFAVETPGWGWQNITLQGYGFLSGEEMDRKGARPPPGLERCHSNKSPQGITLRGVTAADVSGVTLVDFPNHHVIVQVAPTPRGPRGACGTPGRFSNVKVHGWRANGDGIHVFGLVNQLKPPLPSPRCVSAAPLTHPKKERDR